MDYHSIEINSQGDRRRFIKLPWDIYHGDQKWVPPLIREVRGMLDSQKNPFFEYGQVKLFGVCNRDRQIVGRVAAVLNPVHQQLHNDSAGFFGLFECINRVEAAQTLMQAVKDYLRRSNCAYVSGPVNFNTNEESGLLVDGFDDSPMMQCNYCPAYYADLMAACGFEKAMDLFSYGSPVEHSFPGKYARVLKRVAANAAITVRPFNRRRAAEDIAAIREIYNDSFKQVWGFVPLSSAETEAMGKNFLPFSDDELVRIAYHQNKPVGVILALPDVNEILKTLNGRLFPFGIFKFLARRRRIRGVRVVVLGVLPPYRMMGIEALLIHQAHAGMLAGGYQRAEFSVVMENNMKMRKLLSALGFQPIKRYRIYRAAI